MTIYTSPKDGDTVRAVGSNARVTYCPRFSWQPAEHVHSLPWATYQDGTAGCCFASLGAAVEYLRSKGHKITMP